MEQSLARTGILVVTGFAVVGLGLAPAHAAPPGGGPATNASCVGQVFVPQATGEPGAVARRVAEIKRDVLPVVEEKTFGAAVSGLLARADSCRV